jgi:hypothetical protein
MVQEQHILRSKIKFTTMLPPLDEISTYVYFPKHENHLPRDKICQGKYLLDGNFIWKIVLIKIEEIITQY